MLSLLKNNSVLNLWKQATTFIEYIIVLWLTCLIILSISGFVFLIIKWIIDPTMWNNTQFGIYDHWY
jgi:hypothetical protein